MNSPRWIKLIALTALAALLAGCVVLPFGAGHRHGRGDRYDSGSERAPGNGDHDRGRGSERRGR